MTKEPIYAANENEAWRLADKAFVGDYEKDELASKNAGYPIYRSTSQYNCWISDLGTRLELNMNGETTNIWIEDGKRYTAAEVKAIITNAKTELAAVEEILEAVGHMKASATASMVLARVNERKQQLREELAEFGL